MGTGPRLVVGLPWHRYLAVPWAQDRVVSNPMVSAFRRDVVVSADPEFGGMPEEGRDPLASAVGAVLDGGVAGQQVAVSGAPAGGDTFTVAPAPYQSIFTTVANAIAALQQPAQAPAANAQLQIALGSALSSSSQAMDHLTLKQAEIGNQLQQLNSYSTLNDDRTLQTTSALSLIQDVDYAKAASQMAQQQTIYQAALQSYSAVSKLSLFNYL